jgi:membrane protein implicated in regulation of membrane protease activity
MSPALYWFLGGLVLMLLELALPGIILLFIGLGAWVTALAAWLGWVDSLAGQTLVFAIASVVLLVGLRRLFKGWLTGFTLAGDSAHELNEFLGKTVPVVTAIPAGGVGKVEFRGVHWNAQSDAPLGAGASAIITGREGLCLLVRPK